MTVSFNPPGFQPRSPANLDWVRRLETLPKGFSALVMPTPLAEAHWVSYNRAAAPLVGLNAEAPLEDALLAALSGNALLPGSTPRAYVYAGHQFGHLVPQLGDGRALSLGEVTGSEGAMEIQLKGAGITPFSRMGDGRAVLRSSIREYLCSEAMHGLGIPTTRALAITGSPQPVIRETAETAAVVTRLAPSFLRFGSFEYWYYRRDAEAVRTLADFVIHHFYPQFEGDEARYTRMLGEIVERTARLIAQWQAVGFMHGVMNTDNMSVLGLTIDYGPFGFMEAFDPKHICNHSDDGGRYAYANQPDVGLWNLYALGQALVVLAEPEAIEPELKRYTPMFDATLNALLRAKLGLKEARDDDGALVDEMFALMHASRTDFTRFFRLLSEISAHDEISNTRLRDEVIDRARLDAWLVNYRARLQSEQSVDTERHAAMKRANPKYVLRNHLAETAIRKARDEQDFSEIETLRALLSQPFDEQPEHEAYAAAPPAWAMNLEVSCSS